MMTITVRSSIRLKPERPATGDDARDFTRNPEHRDRLASRCKHGRRRVWEAEGQLLVCNNPVKFTLFPRETGDHYVARTMPPRLFLIDAIGPFFRGFIDGRINWSKIVFPQLPTEGPQRRERWESALAELDALDD